MHDDLFQAGGDVGVDIAGTLRHILHVHDCNGNRIVGIERLFAGQHLVEHDTNGIDVALGVGDIATCLLRTDVVHRADCLIGGGAALLPCKLGNAKVHDLDGAVGQKHNVLGLDVPMHNAAIVCVLECPQNLNDKMHSVFPVEHVLAVNEVLQRDTVNELHDDVLHLIRKAHVVDLHDVGMRHHGNCLGLIAEPTLEFLALRVLGLEDLDCHHAIIQHIGGTIYIRHTALAHEFCQFIAAVQSLSNIAISVHLFLLLH